MPTDIISCEPHDYFSTSELTLLDALELAVPKVHELVGRGEITRPHGVCR
jgi:hypothetical protein